MIKLSEYRAERFDLSAKEYFSKMDLMGINGKVSTYMDSHIKRLVLQLETWILAGEHKEHYTYRQTPKTWWQHFKKEVFPKWLLGKFPVEYDEETIQIKGKTYVCPHANVKWPNRKHLEFMTQDIESFDPVSLEDKLKEVLIWRIQLMRDTEGRTCYCPDGTCWACHAKIVLGKEFNREPNYAFLREMRRGDAGKKKHGRTQNRRGKGGG